MKSSKWIVLGCLVARILLAIIVDFIIDIYADIGIITIGIYGLYMKETYWIQGLLAGGRSACSRGASVLGAIWALAKGAEGTVGTVCMLGVGGVWRAVFVGVDVLDAGAGELSSSRRELVRARTAETRTFGCCPRILSEIVSSTKWAFVVGGADTNCDSETPGLGSSLGAGDGSTVCACAGAAEIEVEFL